MIGLKIRAKTLGENGAAFDSGTSQKSEKGIRAKLVLNEL